MPKTKKTIVEYSIYKKVEKVDWPGEYWDGPYTKTFAEKLFKEKYGGASFHVVKEVRTGDFYRVRRR